MIALLKIFFPKKIRRFLRTGQTRFAAWRRRWSLRTPLGYVSLGVFADPRAVSALFGFDRGTPVDRRFMDYFLQAHQSDVHGRVLEVGDSTYARAYGANRVTGMDILHVQPGNSEATLIGNLETGEGIPTGVYDCMILTQTLHCIGDPVAALRNVRKALASGGVALVTLPCVSPISRYDADRWGDYWRFTPQGALRLFSAVFTREEIAIYPFGDRKTAVAFLYGLAVEDLDESAFQHADADCPLLIGVRAIKIRDAE